MAAGVCGTWSLCVPPCFCLSDYLSVGLPCRGPEMYILTDVHTCLYLWGPRLSTLAQPSGHRDQTWWASCAVLMPGRGVCVYVLGFFCLLRVCFLYSSKDPGKRFTTPSPHTWMSEHT